VDAPTAGHPKALSLGALVTEGKTKKIYRITGSDLVSVVAKDDITAGDGAKHDVIPDKGALATATTCNVFRLLKACGLPVAFEEQNSATSFIAPPCTMLPYEVVVRREAHGSALKRSPHFSKGQLFPKLLVEFYLKTKDKDWKGKPLVADDPLMQYEDGAAQIRLFNPAKPILGSEPMCSAIRMNTNSSRRCGRSRGRRSWCWRTPGRWRAAHWSTSRSSSASTPRASCSLPT
jgi:hypothetical protein